MILGTTDNNLLVMCVRVQDEKICTKRKQFIPEALLSKNKWIKNKNF